MSKYTTQLRWVIESGVNLFDFSYPIFDTGYKTALEEKIKNHFYFREIGFETVERFKWELKSKMNRIMPYYNQLYATENLINKDNYFKNLDSVETHTRTSHTGTSGTVDNTVNSSSDATSNERFQDTPQSKLGNEDYATNITDNVNHAEDETGSLTVTDMGVDHTEEYIISMSGGGGVRYNASILMEWRESLINIDEMILDELNELFMGIY